MIKAIDNLALALFVRAMAGFGIDDKLEALANRSRREEGQTATEYVAVVVVGVILALGILYVTLRSAIGNVVQNIAARLNHFISTAS